MSTSATIQGIAVQRQTDDASAAELLQRYLPCCPSLTNSVAGDKRGAGPPRLTFSWPGFRLLSEKRPEAAIPSPGSTSRGENVGCSWSVGRAIVGRILLWIQERLRDQCCGGEIFAP